MEVGEDSITFRTGFVSKKWFLFRVTPLLNFQFDKSYLNSMSIHLNEFLMNHTLKNGIYLAQISVEITTEEVQQKYEALKIDIINKNTHAQLYTGLLLKSPIYSENYKKNNLSDMPVLMAEGKQFMKAVHGFFTAYFDCIIQPYEFSLSQFLWLIAMSLCNAGQLYNERVSYIYQYLDENSREKTIVISLIESDFLRLALSRLSLNQSSLETAFHYSDLLKVHSLIEDHLISENKINLSKLTFKKFEAPGVASISTSGKIYIHSSSLLDLMLKFLMEPENNRKYNY